MSLLKFIKAQFGISSTPSNNFTLDASAQDGSLKLSRGNAGATTQDVMTVAGDGKVDFPAGLSAFVGTNQSLAANGYQKLPGGLIIQWGKTGVLSDDAAATVVTFPIAFPNACLSVNLTADTYNSSAGYFAVKALAATTFSVQWSSTPTSFSTAGYYIAIGY